VVLFWCGKIAEEKELGALALQPFVTRETRQSAVASLAAMKQFLPMFLRIILKFYSPF
jgi:hypothetical protein